MLQRLVAATPSNLCFAAARRSTRREGHRQKARKSRVTDLSGPDACTECSIFRGLKKRREELAGKVGECGRDEIEAVGTTRKV